MHMYEHTYIHQSKQDFFLGPIFYVILPFPPIIQIGRLKF